MLHISNGRYGLTSTCDGADVDPFILHLFATLAEKERAMIARGLKRLSPPPRLAG
jgi:DNA invertase Pin-like site-specific DNA recombinase